MRDLTPRAETAGAGARSGFPALCAWCGEPLDAASQPVPGGLACARCGVTTTAPWPNADELEHAYAGAYRPPGGRFAGPGDRVLRWLRSRLARRVDRIAPPGRVLDVGAGDGTLVDALAGRGRDAIGLERQSNHPRVRAAELADLDPAYAAIVFWHSLEHLSRPAEALERAAALLAPRGVLVIAVPNTDSLQARAFGERWFAIDAPRHLVHVPARALTAKLAELGLRVERTSHVRGGQVLFGWLDGLAGKLPGSPSLWQALRRPSARSRPLREHERPYAIGAATALLPLGLAGVAAEWATRRGGSFYVEARRG